MRSRLKANSDISQLTFYGRDITVLVYNPNFINIVTY